MRIDEHLQAKSDQLNADDLVGGDITVQIEAVKEGDKDQPVVITISGKHHPWKPSKTSLRVLASAWGKDTREWVGRWATLYNDPTVVWAGKPVGGVRVRALSHIAKPFTIKLSVTRGKKKEHHIDRLDTPQAAPDLIDLLQAAKVTEAMLDVWLAEKSKPAFADLSADERSKLAEFFAAKPHILAGMVVR